MISKDTIKRTAGCFWSAEDECFIVESPLFDRLAGTGNSEEEAWAMFEDMLDSTYGYLKARKVIGYNKIGRPSKEGIQLNCKIKQTTHDSVGHLAKALKISQGEVVDVLSFHYFHSVREKPLTESVFLAAVRKVLNEGRMPGLITVREDATRPERYQAQRKTVRSAKRQASSKSLPSAQRKKRA